MNAPSPTALMLQYATEPGPCSLLRSAWMPAAIPVAAPHEVNTTNAAMPIVDTPNLQYSRTSQENARNLGMTTYYNDQRGFNSVFA